MLPPLLAPLILCATLLPQENERLEIYSNGRLRWASDYDLPGDINRQRGRIRARLGARYDVFDDFKVEGRLSTASPGNDANNPHWDFGDGSEGFNGADIVLDRWFVSWDANPDLELRGGKQPHAFIGPAVLEGFLWDNDVQPSGFSGIYNAHLDGINFDVRGATYVAVESGAGADANMFGAQANLYIPTASVDYGAGAAFYAWAGLGGHGDILDNQGNTDPTRDFQVLDTYITASSDLGPWGGWQLSAEYFNNTATGEQDQGYALGARLGRGSKKGDGNVFFTYFDTDADAIFSPVAQDDTPIPGTGAGSGMRGIVAGAQYYVRDDMAFRIWILTSDTDTDDPYRIRFDLDFKIR